MDDQSGTGTPAVDPYGNHDDSEPVEHQITYLQTLLERAYEELSEHKRGLATEIRLPLLMELIGLARTIEDFVNIDGQVLSIQDFRDFLNLGLLGDIRQTLNRYGVEAYAASSPIVDRKSQTIACVEETGDRALAGYVESLRRGYSMGDKVLKKEEVKVYKLRGM
jgi:predicted thioredoxin/glutaredoxin